MYYLWFAVVLVSSVACATVPVEPPSAAPEAAIALGRLLAPLAVPETVEDPVGSQAWPGAYLRADGGVVQVELGRRAELNAGFRGRFTLTQKRDGAWLVGIDELTDGSFRYWGTAEVEPDGAALNVRMNVVVLDGPKGGELVVTGRIRQDAAHWRLEAQGTWDDGMTQSPVQVARNIVPMLGQAATWGRAHRMNAVAPASPPVREALSDSST